MINFLQTRFLARGAALVLISGLCPLAAAVSLDQLSPDDIARDASLSTDAVTGTGRVVMAGFEPFETIADVAGTATLRSTGSALSIDGRALSGGAVLDVALIYTSESNDPYDNRAYEDAFFLSGLPVSKIRYDNRILECSENVTEVVYETPYSSSASHGYLAGVFLALPRYRGNSRIGRRHFGSSARAYRGGALRHQGYSHTARHNGAARVHTGSDRRRDGGNRTRDYREDRRDSRDRETRGTREQGNRDQGNRGTRGRDANNRDGRGTRGGRGESRPTNGLAGMRSDTPRAENNRRNRRVDDAVVTRRETGQQVKIPRRPSQSRGAVSTVKTPSPQRAQRERKERAQTMRPTRDRNAQDSNRSNRASGNASKNRAVNKAFQSKNPRSSTIKTMKNFYPMQAGYGAYARDVYVTPKCAREETLSLHIPADRLEAARFDGLTIFIRSRDGGEVPVYIPPNYIEGYRIASQTMGLSLQNQSYSGGYP